jgi:hypothetical protein
MNQGRRVAGIENIGLLEISPNFQAGFLHKNAG